MATDEQLGDDFGGVDDIDPNLSVVSGRLCHLQAVARRWYDIAGSLWYDRDYGVGVCAWQSASLDSPTQLQRDLEEEALKDERTQACSVDVSAVGERLQISGRITDEDGPFPFTVSVGKLDAKVLLENASA